MDKAVEWCAPQIPQARCCRPGNDELWPAGAERGAPDQLTLLHASEDVAAVDDSAQHTVLDQLPLLVLAHSEPRQRFG